MDTAPIATEGILVGIDGSPSADAALDWAATQAAADGLPVVLLAVAPAHEAAAWLSAHGVDRSHLRVRLKEEARALLRRCDARVHEAHPEVEVRPDIRFDDPRNALLDARPDLLVVGTRGLGPVRRLLVGSVASTVVKHATVPTVVVREAPASASGPGVVVVGVAGDAGDAGALDLAFRIAAARGLSVAALHSLWDVVGVDQSRDIGPDEPGYDDQWALLSDAVAPAAARHPDVEVTYRLSRGFADERLIRAAQHADLVVVGHRRKPLLHELVYGSLAPEVVEHAPCSVAVVPFCEDAEPTAE